MENKSISGKYWTNAGGHHWSQSEWRAFVTPADFENLKCWRSGEDLPELNYTNHLAPKSRRIAQYILHRFMVRLWDRHRQGWRPDSYPDQIPDPIVRKLHGVLSNWTIPKKIADRGPRIANDGCRIIGD